MKIRFLFLLSVFPYLLFAEETSYWMEKLNRQKETVGETKVEVKIPRGFDVAMVLKMANKLQKSEAEKKKLTAASEWVVKTERGNAKNSSGSGGVFRLTFGNNKPTQTSQSSAPKQNTPYQTNNIMFRLVGYCYVDRDIVVFGKVPVYADLPCAFEGISKSSFVFGEFKPEIDSYTLRFIPQEVRIGDRFYKVKGGIVLSGDKTSVNVASMINVPVIKRILAKAGSDAGQQVADITKDMAKNSATSVSITGDVTVKKTEFNVSVLKDAALWTGIASLIKSTADYFGEESKRIPVTFRVDRGSRIFLNIKVSEDKTQIPSGSF